MNNPRSNRVFYDSITGAVLWQTGEVVDSSFPIPHQEIVGDIRYVDVEVGTHDYMSEYISHVDIATGEPVFKNTFDPLTAEQLRIKQLEEDILLLQTDANEGGIL